ncbi:hypothetical protein HK099_000992 [Clydaea vesicula]|uniref:Uncharacterized protein n=1 Tax=Clydaea vesicula TaxID=447962 RepID=A0AAD5XX79_9FUNG|nr:hypothetical protein HK099_000992 [Clydaea vesicula]
MKKRWTSTMIEKHSRFCKEDSYSRQIQVYVPTFDAALDRFELAMEGSYTDDYSFPPSLEKEIEKNFAVQSLNRRIEHRKIKGDVPCEKIEYGP